MVGAGKFFAGRIVSVVVDCVAGYAVIRWMFDLFPGPLSPTLLVIATVFAAAYALQVVNELVLCLIFRDVKTARRRVPYRLVLLSRRLLARFPEMGRIRFAAPVAAVPFFLVAREQDVFANPETRFFVLLYAVTLVAVTFYDDIWGPAHRIVSEWWRLPRGIAGEEESGLGDGDGPAVGQGEMLRDAGGSS